MTKTITHTKDELQQHARRFLKDSTHTKSVSYFEDLGFLYAFVELLFEIQKEQPPACDPNIPNKKMCGCIDASEYDCSKWRGHPCICACHMKEWTSAALKTQPIQPRCGRCGVVMEGLTKHNTFDMGPVCHACWNIIKPASEPTQEP